MAKGPLITPQVEALIASVYEQHPKWKAPMVRNEVESILRKKNRNSPKGWPSLSIIQKTLATVRKNLANPSPEDEPWSLSSLGEFPIPPEALPKVVEEYKRHRLGEGTGEDKVFPLPEKLKQDLLKKGVNLDRFPKTQFTIRDAKWVARLSATQCKVSDRLPYAIAQSERLYELVGRRPEWEVFDKLLADLWLEPTELAEVVMVEALRKMPFLLVLPDDNIKELKRATEEYYVMLDTLLERANDRKTLDKRKGAKHERKHKAKKQK